MTTEPLHPVQIRRFREMTPEEKWQVALGLLPTAREPRCVTLRQRHDLFIVGMTPSSATPPARWPRPNAALRPELSIEDRLALARDSARFLRSQGAARVLLFGSLAKGRRQDFRSDLDLAVEGLPPERYLGCLGELLMRLPLGIDLVELETASPALRAQILADGLLLTDAD